MLALTRNSETSPYPMPPCAAPAPRLVRVRRNHPRRGEVEAFVRRIYAARHGADVRQFAPSLVALLDAGDEIVAAAGYRAADEEALFLERYLAAPVETVLGRAVAQAPARGRIVEVGHLAAERAGEGRRLILLLGPHLAAQGFHWVVGTLTAELRHLFVRLGVAPLALGVADPGLLGAEAAHWGRYYDHRPVVLAGQLELALQALGRRQQRSAPGGVAVSDAASRDGTWGHA